MYRCYDCNESFREPRRMHACNLHSELDSGKRYEEYDFGVCPECGSKAIEETGVCDVCRDEALDFESTMLCTSCKKELFDEIRNADDVYGTVDDIKRRFDLSDDDVGELLIELTLDDVSDLLAI